MATQSQHQKQWLHNRAFLKSIVHQPDNSDWITTVAFYTAVHAIQTLLCADGNDRATTHESRSQILYSIPRYKDLIRDFKALYDASRAARYDCSGWLDSTTVRAELIRNRLYRIEERVNRLGKLNVALPDLLSM